MDGLRAVAVVLVMALHAGLPVAGGRVGVTLFFVLSGYLITTILLREFARDERVALRWFFFRRFARLSPALVAMVGVISIASLLFPGGMSSTALSWTWAPLTYTSNWVRAFAGNQVLGVYGHTWSLSVEEQFYIIWPLLLLLSIRVFGSISAVGWVAVAGCAASLTARLVVARGVEGYARIYNGLDTQADQLLAGCLLGVLLFRFPQLFEMRWSRILAVGGGMAVLTLAFTWHDKHATALDHVLLSVAAFGSALAIGGVLGAPTSFISKALSARVLTWVGKRSYSLYLWHYPFFLLLQAKGAKLLPWGSLQVIVWLAAVAAAAASYRFIEQPALAWARTFEQRSKNGRPAVIAMNNSAVQRA